MRSLVVSGEPLLPRRRNAFFIRATCPVGMRMFWRDRPRSNRNRASSTERQGAVVQCASRWAVPNLAASSAPKMGP